MLTMSRCGIFHLFNPRMDYGLDMNTLCCIKTLFRTDRYLSCRARLGVSCVVTL